MASVDWREDDTKQVSVPILHSLHTEHCVCVTLSTTLISPRMHRDKQSFNVDKTICYLRLSKVQHF